MTAFTLIFPQSIAESIVGVLGGILDSRGGLVDFAVMQYGPVLRKALEDANVSIDFKTKLGFFFKVTALLIKIVSLSRGTVDLPPLLPFSLLRFFPVVCVSVSGKYY